MRVIQVIVFLGIYTTLFSQNIREVLDRHTVRISKLDSLSSLSLGNGRFCMTVDATGLQSFPEKYLKGVSLGTQSEWGWHAFPNVQNYKFEETLVNFPFDGRQVPYSVQSATNKEAVNYFRQNPHRIHLGLVGFEFLNERNEVLGPDELISIDQKLNLFTGILTSKFFILGQNVSVEVFVDQSEDRLWAKVQSELLKQKGIRIKISLPQPSNQFIDNADTFSAQTETPTLLKNNTSEFTYKRELDSTRYFIKIASEQKFNFWQKNEERLELEPITHGSLFSFSVSFAQNDIHNTKTSFIKAKGRSIAINKKWWAKSAVVDFGLAHDPRAKELERRVALSLYLTKIQCSGAEPPQETGLTFNSWFGRPHLEMHWWHVVHFGLWGHTAVLKSQIDWYVKHLPKARELAKRQGYQGVRWQKMTSPDGADTPSSVGAFLIWQQPHIIYLVDLYRSKTGKLPLEYRPLIDETAIFMDDFLQKHPNNESLSLGPGIIPAQENFKPAETYNPTFELAYWRWALSKAVLYTKDPLLKQKWSESLTKLSQPTVQNQMYLSTESTPDAYTNADRMKDHPAVLGAFGMLPQTDGIEHEIMKNTLEYIEQHWNWEHTWGWDFPLAAMTATRLNLPEKTVDLLLKNVQKNTYLVNGHNYQDPRLRIYLPGNGGLLAAVALMCQLDGFPKAWNVKHKGFK